MTAAKVLALAAVGLAGVYLWRVLQKPSAPAAHQVLHAETAPSHPGEEFSPAERHELDDVLKRKGAGAPPH